MESYPCESLKKCVILDVLFLPGHRAACVKSIQIRDAYTTRVLLGNTAYCNIYWVSNYKQERKSRWQDTWTCSADMRPPQFCVIRASVPYKGTSLCVEYACGPSVVHHSTSTWHFTLFGGLPQEVLMKLYSAWGILIKGYAYAVRTSKISQSKEFMLPW